MAVDVTIIPCRSDNFGYLLTQSETGARAVVDAPEAGPFGPGLRRSTCSVEQG